MAVQPNSVCHSGTTVFVFPRNAKKNGVDVLPVWSPPKRLSELKRKKNREKRKRDRGHRMAQLTTLDRASWPKLAHIGPATNPLFSPTSLTPYTTNPLLSLTNARRKPSSIPPPVPSTRPPPAESAPPHAGRGGGSVRGSLDRSPFACW
jgi:hypothetical protein